MLTLLKCFPCMDAVSDDAEDIRADQRSINSISTMRRSKTTAMYEVLVRC